jgi:general secretion pathway protein F
MMLAGQYPARPGLSIVEPPGGVFFVSNPTNGRSKISVRPSAREFAEFNGLLCSIVEKGLPLPPAVDLMAGVVRDRSLREALNGVARALADGASLPDALGRFPDVFPSDYCALIRAGVDSGRLADVLRSSQIHHAFRARIRSKMSRLLLYLLAGAIMGELVLAFAVTLGTYSSALSRQTASQMELRNRPAIVEWAENAADSTWILLVAWPAVVGLGFAGYRILQGSARGGTLQYFVPIWGRIEKSRDLASFCCAAALRLKSGAALIDALQSARDSVRNRKFRALVAKVLRRIEDGESLSSALFYVGFFPKTLAWGVSLGEENGEVPRAFDTFAELYTKEMERNFLLLQEFLTPLGILAVGNVALLGAFLILSPFIMLIQISSSL